MSSLRIFWLIVFATVSVYATMLLWSIPLISKEADGLVVFDMLPTGYSFAEAQAFLSALTPEGKQFYLKVQHRLDLLYPALLAITVGWAMMLLVPNWRWRPLLALVPIPGMVFDYLENSVVAAMLAAGSDSLTPEMVERASMYSRSKAVSTTLSLGLLCLFIVVWAFNRWKKKTT